jgi:hypothetical protein
LRHPGRFGSGEKQTKYESATPSQGLKFADKASRIFRFDPAVAKMITESSGRPILRAPQTETGGPCVGQTVKESASRFAWHRRLKNKRQPSLARPSIESWLTLWRPLGASKRDLRTIRRTNHEGIALARFAPYRPLKNKPQPSLSRQAIQSWLTRSESRSRHLAVAPCQTVAGKTNTSGNGARTASLKSAWGPWPKS